MTIQTATGAYYTASQTPTGAWTVNRVTPKTYLEVLPDGWEDTAITWERDLSYLGIFRSMTNSSFKFSKDGRAIIQNIRNTQGIRGYGLLTIWILNENDFDYSIFYRSQLNFRTYKDYQQTFSTEIGTLDSGLIRDFRAYGDTKYNNPVWQPDGLGWVTDSHWVLHDGMKLLYNATYISSATGDTPSTALLYELGGFNHGRHATAPSPDEGRHTLPNMVQFNITQNNGTTTYIGNDILNNLLPTGNQTPGLDSGASWSAMDANELNFSGRNESQPWSRNNYALKNAMTQPPNTFDMSVAVSGKWISDPITYFDNGNGSFIAFVIFEIDSENNPITIAGRYQYQLIYKQDLPAGGTTFLPSPLKFSNYDTPVTITINPNKVYVFGIIYDEDAAFGGLSGDGSKLAFVGWEALQFSFFSKYDYGASGVPIPAPQLNPSVFSAYRLHELWAKVVPYLATRSTDSNGFPIPVTTDYEGVSTFLSNPALPPIGDVVPYNIMVTSSYCIHDLQGLSYISVAANQIFDFCKKVLGCGLGIDYDANGVATKLRIEDLAYFFNDATMILDLGNDIANFEIIQAGDEFGIGCNLKLGYTKADTNTDFGVDPHITGLFFNTPVSEIEGTMEFEADEMLCEPYAIEKIRAQKVNQPIGASFDPANPSGDNSLIGLYCMPTQTVILPDTGGNPDYPNVIAYDPDNNPLSTFAYQLWQYNGINLPVAQSTDPTAATSPYVNGLYYPDTAINLPLSPKRALERCTGRLIHSYLDKMDADSLVFRNTYVMQYNNRTLALSGMESNLNIGSGASGVIQEMADKRIYTLPPQLFLPVIGKVTSTSGRNLYHILNSNPNGYIRFFAQKEGFGMKEYKMFLTRATQKATLDGNISTEFEGLFLPTQTF